MTFGEFLLNPEGYKDNYIPKPDNRIGMPALVDRTFEYVRDLLFSIGELKEQQDITEYISDKVIGELARIERMHSYDVKDILDYICYYIQEISDVTDMESQIQSVAPRPDISSFVNQIGFEGFSYFPQVYDLTQGDVTKYAEVMNTKYIICYQYLLYKTKLSDLEFLLQRDAENKTRR